MKSIVDLAEQVVLSKNTETLLPCIPGKVRLYNEDYIAIGFTWSGIEKCPLPEYVICGGKAVERFYCACQTKATFLSPNILTLPTKLWNILKG